MSDREFRFIVSLLLLAQRRVRQYVNTKNIESEDDRNNRMEKLRRCRADAYRLEGLIKQELDLKL